MTEGQEVIVVLFSSLVVLALLTLFIYVRTNRTAARGKVVDGYVYYDTSGSAEAGHGCGHHGGHDAGGHGGDCGSH